MSNKFLDLTKEDQRGQFQLLEQGKRFAFKNQVIDIRKITEAKANELAADYLCKFLGKEGVVKVDPTAPQQDKAEASAVPEANDAPDYAKMKKSELVALAKERQLTFDENATKEALIELLSA